MWMQDNSKFIPVVEPNMAKERTIPHSIAMDQRLSTFAEVEQTYTQEEAANEAARCLKCPTHWCQKACPAGVPVTDFIALARSGDYEGAYRLIRTASMLPEFCSRICPQEKQCQSNCTRSIRSQSVGIGKLERFVVEQHYASGAEELHAPATGKRVAVIGSGPSGLSTAQRLTDLGYSVTVFEKNDRPGGLLEYGIPNMKLEKSVVDRKIASLQQQGVTFRTGVNVGVELPAEDVIAEYDAVILSAGTGNARGLSPQGVETVKSGIVRAVDFLTEATKAALNNAIAPTAKDKQVVIVGGGDTGSDCVATSIRQGCAGIAQIEMMPKTFGRTILHEPHPLLKEKKVDYSMVECDARFRKDPHIYQTTVKAVKADAEGNITSVTLVSLEPSYDKTFRISMHEVPGTEQEIPCDLLVVAAGFLGPQAYVAESFGVKTGPRSNIDTANYATNVPKVYACGDCRTGQSLVVKAMVDGRNCADAVHQALSV